MICGRPSPEERRAIVGASALLILSVLLIALLASCAGGSGALLSGEADREPVPRVPASLGEPVEEVELLRVAGGLRRPVALTHAGDERLFIAEQRGLVRVIRAGETLPEPFLDVADRISIDGSERGLLGIAFHPNYSDNGYFYVVYTNLDGDSELTRFTVSADDPDRADPSSASLILRVPQPFGNHNGGQLLFGPDGYLYAGFGDGGAVGDPEDNAQNPATVLGAIIRLNVDSGAPYKIPADNPFRDESGAPYATWQIGLRNPWAFSFDPASGDLFIADVGQEGPEEINFLPAGVAGANFGWPVREGDRCFESAVCPSRGLEPPVVTYEHDEGCAVIGGYVYRGGRFPSLDGNYFFSDFCQGTLWALRHNGDIWVRRVVANLGAPVSALGVGVDGELYIVNYDAGEVWQITAAP